MYAVERRQEIATLIEERGRGDVTELADRFDVTPETIRRDLTELEQRRLLRRVHGGAISIHRFRLRAGDRREGRQRWLTRRRRSPRRPLVIRPRARLGADRRRHVDARARPDLPRPGADRVHAFGGDRARARGTARPPALRDRRAGSDTNPRERGRLGAATTGRTSGRRRVRRDERVQRGSVGCPRRTRPRLP